jgi:hypothetical protein
MATFYEVWDDSSRNRLGEFETLAEARALLQAVLKTSGADAARDLAVLSYTPNGTGDYQVATVLEGADIVASQPDDVTLAPSSGSGTG